MLASASRSTVVPACRVRERRCVCTSARPDALHTGGRPRPRLLPRRFGEVGKTTNVISFSPTERWRDESHFVFAILEKRRFGDPVTVRCRKRRTVPFKYHFYSLVFESDHLSVILFILGNLESAQPPDSCSKKVFLLHESGVPPVGSLLEMALLKVPTFWDIIYPPKP